MILALAAAHICRPPSDVPFHSAVSPQQQHSWLAYTMCICGPAGVKGGPIIKDDDGHYIFDSRWDCERWRWDGHRYRTS